MVTNMRHMDWKLLIGIGLALIVVTGLILRFTRGVPPYHPSQARPPDSWGSLDQKTAQSLQIVLDDEVNRLKVPGLQAFVRSSDGKTWLGASGTVDLARRQPLQRDQVLRVGSVTKTFTAVLILQLVEEGKLSLDDRLERWFPEFPNARQITIRTLLNHRSGIPEYIPNVLMKSILPWTVWTPQEVAAIAAQNKPAFAPDSDFGYSNANYVLLGLIAEKVTGQTVAQLLRARIIDPLGLQNTYFVPYEQAPETLAGGYDRDLSHFPGMLDITRENTSWATAGYASAALASTADGLGVFYEQLFEGDMLSPDSLGAMMTFPKAPNPGLPEQIGYGLGLMQMEVDGRELVGHVGEFMGSTAVALYSPSGHYQIVVLCNLSYPNLFEVVRLLQRIIQ